MSIQISKNPESYKVDRLQNKIVINTYDIANTKLIELNTNNDITNIETYIQIGPNIKFGSSNNLFVIKDNTEDKDLLNLNSDLLTFNQEVYFQNNINILNNVFFNHNYTLIQKSIQVQLHNDETFSINNNILNITKDNVHIDSLISSNLHIINTLYVDKIIPISDNIIIEGLLLEDYKALNGSFKNNINIDYNILVDGICDNNTSININKLSNGCNFVNLYESNLQKLSINNNGYINIGDIHNVDIPIHIYSDEYYTIKTNDNFSLNNKGQLSLGTIKDNNTFLNIHHNDNVLFNNESLSIFSIDYNPLSNYNINNLEQLLFNKDNIQFYINILEPISSASESVIELNFLFNSFNSNIKWFHKTNDETNDEYSDLNGINDIKSDINLKLKIENIDYGDYSFKYIYIGNKVNLLTFHSSNNFTIKLITGFYLQNENIISDLMDDLVLNNDINDLEESSNYDLIYTHYTNSDIYNTIGLFEDIHITFDIYTLIEKSSNIHYIPYIDTTPKLELPPHFIDFQSNNENIGYLDGSGLLNITDLNVNNNSTFKNVYIDNILNDIDFNLQNLNNIQDINILGTIHIGDIKISSANGIELGSDTSVESKINSVNISNINSPFFKYNTEQTSILNFLNIGSNLNVLNSIRHNNSYNIIVSGQESIYLDGKLNFNNSHIIECEESTGSYIHDIPITTYLAYKNNNTTFIRNYTSQNLLTFSDDDFICVSTNSNLNNKITIGVPSVFITNNDIEVKDWYYYFNNDKYITDHFDYSDLYKLHPISTDYLNHTATIFGNTRFSDINNITIAEIRDNTENHSLTVYGNIKCSKKIINISHDPIQYDQLTDALYVDGNASIEGKIYTTGGIASLSDKNVKTNIQYIKNSIQKIKKISGYTYYRTDLHKNDTGLIAQEVEEILPEVIELNNNNHKTITYGNMTGLLVEAIKDINNRLEILEKKLL